MNFKKIALFVLLFPVLVFFSTSCNTIFSETDAESFQMVSFFDLRDRESFVQITNTGSSDNRIHVQIFDVDNNCNENNFFDNLTGNDTHVYNLRDIQTNDGNPSGVVLPGSAYGIVVITLIDSTTNLSTAIRELIGNFRVIDNIGGYEYRTNSLSVANTLGIAAEAIPEFYLNYNQQGGVTLSDVVGFLKISSLKISSLKISSFQRSSF